MAGPTFAGARCSGVSTEACVAHIGPEALADSGRAAAPGQVGVYDVERTVRALAAGLETLESLATLPNDDENEP